MATGIELDGPAPESVTVDTIDGTAITDHSGVERTIRVAPGLFAFDPFSSQQYLDATGALVTGQPYLDPAGVPVSQQAVLGYDGATGQLFIEVATDPQVRGFALVRGQLDRAAPMPDRTVPRPDPVSAAAATRARRSARKVLRSPAAVPVAVATVRRVRAQIGRQAVRTRTLTVQAAPANVRHDGQPDTLIVDRRPQADRDQARRQVATLTSDRALRDARQERQPPLAPPAPVSRTPGEPTAIDITSALSASATRRTSRVPPAAPPPPTRTTPAEARSLDITSALSAAAARRDRQPATLSADPAWHADRLAARQTRVPVTSSPAGHAARESARTQTPPVAPVDPAPQALRTKASQGGER